MKKILVIGGSSAIASATIELLLQSNENVEIHCVSRNIIDSSRVQQTYRVDNYSKSVIDSLCCTLVSQNHQFDAVLIFNGQLYTQNFMPEKKVSQFNELYLDELIASNVLPHLFWYSHLHTLIPKETESKILVLSARIGSISDNRSGGWYSYRMTKAMLNMATKCYSIELARTHPKAKILLFHPGTTDTPLSHPFQKNIPKNKLFEPEYTAQCISNLLNTSYESTHIEYLDWQQQPIEW